MSKQKFVRVLSIFLTFLVSGSIFAITTYADSIYSFKVDDSTRWSNFIEGATVHMGSRNTTYKYEGSAVKNKYSTYIKTGISLWGSSISCTESNSSPMGIITASTEKSNANALTTVTCDTSTNHIISWTLKIYSNNFDANSSDDGKYKTIAHEIGHVYGLGHVDYSSQIMYGTYSQSKNITSYDRAGMSVMTHTHNHNGNYSTTTEKGSVYSHKVRCNTCKAYRTANCLYTEYHLGSKHYYVADCFCGNKYTHSWACSGKPCIMPFSVQLPHELE